MFTISRSDDLGSLSFAEVSYDRSLKCFKPSEPGFTMSQFIVCPTKREAVKKAKELHWSASHIEKIGNRYGIGYGFRHDHRDNFFMTHEQNGLL